MKKVLLVNIAVMAVVVFIGLTAYYMANRKIFPAQWILGMALSGDATKYELELKLRRIFIIEINGKVNGIAVAPAPDKKINDATVAGVDANKNGVRDDVERLIAQKFGREEKLYNLQMKGARLLQAAITETPPSKEEQLRNQQGGMENFSFGPTVREYVALLKCMSDSELRDADYVTHAILTTGIRVQAYRATFAGVIIGSCH